VNPDLQIRRALNGQSAWESATVPVPAVLNLHVRSWIGVSETGAARCRRREIPGPHVILVFEFGPPLRISQCGAEDCTLRHRGGFVAGLYDSFVTTEHDGCKASIQVTLTPRGARTLLAPPLSEISRAVVELSDLLPNARGLSDRLASTTSWVERFRAVERVLLERLLLATSLRSDIVWSVEQIEASGGLRKVGDLANTLRMSRRHFNVLFRDHVGMPPKVFSNLVRFDRLNLRILGRPARSWADLALEAGFADQAHMVREVKRFSGMSPTALRGYLADMAYLCPPDAFPSADVLEKGSASREEAARTGAGSVEKSGR
jgi:AraC-like DNA-binding protein